MFNSWMVNYENGQFVSLKSWLFTCFKVSTKLVAIVCLKYQPVYRLELKSCMKDTFDISWDCVFLYQNSSKEK